MNEKTRLAVEEKEDPRTFRNLVSVVNVFVFRLASENLEPSPAKQGRENRQANIDLEEQKRN